MREAVHISWAEDEASPELERILAKLALAVTRRAGPLPAGGIIFAKKMEEIRRAEPRGLISLAMVIDQKQELDSCFLAKRASVVGVAQADGGQRSSFVPEGLLVFAQLRDVFAAKNSSVMAEKDEHRRAVDPERSEPDFLAIRVGKRNLGEPAA